MVGFYFALFFFVLFFLLFSFYSFLFTLFFLLFSFFLFVFIFVRFCWGFCFVANLHDIAEFAVQCTLDSLFDRSFQQAGPEFAIPVPKFQGEAIDFDINVGDNN